MSPSWPITSKPGSRMDLSYATDLEAYAVPVGAGLPAMRPDQALEISGRLNNDHRRNQIHSRQNHLLPR